jgi:hypothetical protein
MSGNKFHHVDTIVAAIGPAGVAFHTHHIVAAFHRTKVRVAHPIIERVSRQEEVYCALMSSNGSNPKKSVMQLAPSHGMDKNSADARHSAAFVFFENCRLNCIILQI